MQISDIPRVDRGAIWGRAEEIQRLNPHMSAAGAFHYAIREYEHGHIAGTHDSEKRLAEAARDHPDSLFRH